MTRDLESMCTQERLCGDLEPYSVEVEMKKSLGEMFVDGHEVFLPHELAHSIWEAYPGASRERFACDRAEEYWKNAKILPMVSGTRLEVKHPAMPRALHTGPHS